MDAVEIGETAAGVTDPGIHELGGRSRNAPLCQALANALGRPVWAGPPEAPAIGNLLMQLLAAGEIGSIQEGAALVDGHGVQASEPTGEGTVVHIHP